MSTINFIPQDSPESDSAEQTNFELSEYFTFDEWLEDDHASKLFGSLQNPVYRANEVVEPGGTSTHFEGPSNSKQSSKFFFHVKKKFCSRVSVINLCAVVYVKVTMTAGRRRGR